MGSRGTNARLFAGDLDMGALELKLKRGLEMLHRGRPTRKHELHVSDFTKSDKSFCYRTLILRYLKGESEDRMTTWVQYDGKFREEKWKQLLEITGFLKPAGYQMELRVGNLVGHPDFILDYHRGPLVMDLTGYDPTLDPILRATRLGEKKRQVRMYLGMYEASTGVKPYRGVVLYENKGTCAPKLLPVELDDKVAPLMERAAKTEHYIAYLREHGTKVWSSLPPCEKKRCKACGKGKANDSD